MAAPMRLRPSRLGGQMVSAAALCALAEVFAPRPVLAQDGGIPRAWDGRPDLNGAWQAIGTAHWDLEDHPSAPCGDPRSPAGRR